MRNTSHRPGLAKLSVIATMIAGLMTGIGVLSGAPAMAASGWGVIGNYHSGKCLDDTNGSTTSGTQLQIWSCLYNSNQEWRVLNYVNLSGVNYNQIQNKKSAKCLDLSGGSRANGAHIIQYTCNRSDDAQLWYIISVGGGWDIFENHASGTCMTVSADSQSNGAKIQGWSCATSESDHAYWWEPHFVVDAYLP
jgi:Ricin-type beta-trefoil lectin domain